jgi:hypothetical protein
VGWRRVLGASQAESGEEGGGGSALGGEWKGTARSNGGGAEGRKGGDGGHSGAFYSQRDDGENGRAALVGDACVGGAQSTPKQGPRTLMCGSERHSNVWWGQTPFDSIQIQTVHFNLKISKL